MIAVSPDFLKTNNIRIKAAKIFLAAANYIRQYGWQVSDMGTHGGPRCSMGALASANPEAKWDKKLAALMYRTLYYELQEGTLTEFNKRVNNGESVARLFEQVARSLLTPLYD